MKTVNAYPICNSLSTLGIGAAQFRSVTEIAPKRNHCSHVRTEALSGMVFAPAQKLSGINSNVDINPFAPGDFAEKRVLKLVEWFSGHFRAIKS